MQSMTAFASHEAENKLGKLSCEIRSVNQRFLELSIKCPDFLRASENTLRKLFSQSISRGKISVFIRFYPNDDTSLTELTVNHALVKQLNTCASSIENKHQMMNDVAVAQILNWPDVVVQQPSDTSALSQFSVELTKTCIDKFINSRRREGLEMKNILQDKIDTIQHLTEEIRTYIPQINEHLKSRLLTKLEDMKLEVDNERFEQEIAFQLQKIDITEELDRLDAHVKEFNRVLQIDEPVGRRLDFLTQELNRESNTIGSKSASIKTSNASIDLKVTIEQIREQIQNIE
ncbi:MAG: YicC/YloC family endoribonuclease [Marinicella sp.]|nr:YicC family protein [Xanthomonadales bacterium]